MKQLQFTIDILAAPETVWFVLWDDAHYRTWCAVFHEGSTYTGKLETGGRIHFHTPEGDGMYSDITACTPAQEIRFEHRGHIKNHEELPPEPDAGWGESFESYHLSRTETGTLLTVNLKTPEQYADFFDEVFPQALARVKALCEDLFIEISTVVHVPLARAWDCWTNPAHIVHWNFASDDWQCPWAENDVRTGGRFKSRMEAKDGSMGFEFEGVYTEVIPEQKIAYALGESLGDARTAVVLFERVNENATRIVETFRPENTFPLEMQRGGWYAILMNFKKHTESH